MQNNRILTGILIILCVLVALIGYTNPNAPNTLTIEPSSIIVNPGQNIQAAINSVPGGSTIIVNSGNYTENLKLFKNITLVAKGLGV
jgi:hypothetical protein